MVVCKGKKRTHLILGIYENIWKWYACTREKKAPEIYLQRSNKINESRSMANSRKKNFRENNT